MAFSWLINGGDPNHLLNGMILQVGELEEKRGKLWKFVDGDVLGLINGWSWLILLKHQLQWKWLKDVEGILVGGNSNIFYVQPDPGEEDSQFDERIFQLGWFNHQLVIFLGLINGWSWVI